MDSSIREKIYFFNTFGGDYEALGITADNRYVYCGYIGTTDMKELFEISRETYLKFVNAFLSKDTEMLEELRREIYTSPSIAFEGSQYEPLPIALPRYSSEVYAGYLEFIMNNTVICARYEEGVLTLETADGKTTEFEITIPI